MTEPMPKDLFKGGRDKYAEYANQVDAARDALGKRIDVAYQIYLEVNPDRVNKRFLPEVMARFESMGRPVGYQTLADDIKIFRVLRLHLGMSRAQVQTISYRRMRTVAQNEIWALANTDLARQSLLDPALTEERLRALITERPRPAPQGGKAMQFVFSRPAARRIDRALKAAAETLPGTHTNEDLLLTIVREWQQLRRTRA